MSTRNRSAAKKGSKPGRQALKAAELKAPRMSCNEAGNSLASQPIAAEQRRPKPRHGATPADRYQTIEPAREWWARLEGHRYMIQSPGHKESSRSRRDKTGRPARDTLPSLCKSEWRRIRPRHRLFPIGSDGRWLVQPANDQTGGAKTRDPGAVFRSASFAGHPPSVLRSMRGIGPIRMTNAEKETARSSTAEER